MSDEERVARFRMAALRWKAAHWRPQTPAEKGVGWSTKVNAMTRGEDPRQSVAWWAERRRIHFARHLLRTGRVVG